MENRNENKAPNLSRLIGRYEISAGAHKLQACHRVLSACEIRKKRTQLTLNSATPKKRYRVELPLSAVLFRLAAVNLDSSDRVFTIVSRFSSLLFYYSFSSFAKAETFSKYLPRKIQRYYLYKVLNK